ncbi:MAG: MBL fold metallo-hydrolase [Anaerolineales bacterium]|nr:MBL fold metallo-hydrolase [Anaerolineales bacterium]
MSKDRFRFQVGEFDCIVINDGEVAGNAEMLFVNAPTDQLEEVLHAYKLEPNHLPSTWSCLLVKTASNVVLIDTGIGSGLSIGGNLSSILAEEGYARRDIDIVILTHGHGDHIGGGVTETGEIAFPNATYYMGKKEWEYWMSEEMLAQESDWAADFARRKLRPLASVLQTVEDRQEIVPGIQMISASGHTVGHMAVHITSAEEQLLYLADVALHPIHIEYPDWYGRVDHDPEQTVLTRRKIYQWAVKRESLVLAYHFPPFPSLGRIVNKGDDYEWKRLDRLSEMG